MSNVTNTLASDLDGLSLAELKALEKKIAKAIAS